MTSTLLFPDVKNGKADPDEVQKHTVEELKLKEETEAEKLFDKVAKQVANFITEKSITKRLPLGFTFSFPTENFSLNSGKLLRWTKGFQAEDAIGKDPVQLLKDAFVREGVSIHVRL